MGDRVHVYNMCGRPLINRHIVYTYRAHPLRGPFASAENLLPIHRSKLIPVQGERSNRLSTVTTSTSYHVSSPARGYTAYPEDPCSDAAWGQSKAFLFKDQTVHNIKKPQAVIENSLGLAN